MKNVSAFLDSLLQNEQFPPFPHIYVRDSTHIVSLLSSLTLHKNTTLVKVDVSSLYTTIPQEEGIKACLEHIIPQTFLHKLYMYYLTFSDSKTVCTAN